MEVSIVLSTALKNSSDVRGMMIGLTVKVSDAPLVGVCDGSPMSGTMGRLMEVFTLRVGRMEDSAACRTLYDLSMYELPPIYRRSKA
jgi:hypothetical protein